MSIFSAPHTAARSSRARPAANWRSRARPRVLEILQAELKLAMGNCGMQTVADITRAYVATPDWRS
jgi:isopentenyl diphosphate isomerase/L-lactate dehydrogenase-like FMN-dependent dehydrogenase